MRTLRNTLIICLAALLSYSGLAFSGEEPDRNLVAKELKSYLEKMTDFTANIVQEKRIALFDSSIVSSGHIKWKKPDKLFVAMNPPDASQLFLNGKGLWLYYPDEKIAEKYVMKDDQKLSDAFSFFSLLHRLKEEDFTPIITIRADIVTLELTPSGRLFKKVKLRFSRKDWLIVKIELFEHNGDSTVIAYTNAVINSGISDKTFLFFPPKDVKVSSLNEFNLPWQ